MGYKENSTKAEAVFEALAEYVKAVHGKVELPYDEKGPSCEEICNMGCGMICDITPAPTFVAKLGGKVVAQKVL